MGRRAARLKVDFAQSPWPKAVMIFAIPFPEISPIAVTLPVIGFPIRWYALAYIVGILIGWRIAVAAVRRPHLWAGGQSPASPKEVEDLLTWIILGVILGGRLGYVLFYNPGYYLQNPLEILWINQGGMAFHGGFLGVIAAVVLFARRNKLPVGNVADILAIAAPAGILLGRLANFINAELWGRASDMPWAVIFPGAAAQDCPGFEGVPGFCARHPSQLYEAALEGLLLGIILLVLAFRRGWFKTPWALTAVFFAGYGLARFFVEFFRQADPQFITAENPMGYVVGTADLGLTMGQLLSLPMVALGLLIWLLFVQRPSPAGQSKNLP
jgi:phosphatidylglycerol:prolipoprotein diacylglycerol transferase